MLQERNWPILETKAEDDDGGDDEDTLANLTADFEQKMTGFREELKTSTANLTAAEKRIRELETKLARGGGVRNQEEDEGKALERKAFYSYVRRGLQGLGADEVKALRVSDDTAGGFLTPPEFLTELLRDIVQFSPIRTAARVGTMSAGAIMLPKRTGRMTAKWVGELEKRPETKPTYGLIEMAAHEMAAWVNVSMWLLEDSAINIEQELAYDFAEEFGRLEGEAFLIGDGVKKPVGLLADPGVGYVANGHATTLNPDSLIQLMYSLPPFYRNRGSWIMNGVSIAAVRLFKDSSGQYLWREGLTEGQPPTLLGRPVVEAVDMADIAANAFPILFGDIMSAYRIWDKQLPTVKRYDDAQLAEDGLVRFQGRRRLAAGVVRPDAVKKLKMATS